MNIHVLGLAALVFTSSCQTRQRASTQRNVIKELPQMASHPAFLGMTDTPQWRQIRQATAGRIERPWPDSAWTVAERGLARRGRAVVDVSGGAVSADPLGFADQVEDLRMALAKKDRRALALLSPAEKYDIVATGASLSSDQIAALTAVRMHSASQVDTNFRRKRAELVRIQTEVLAADRRIRALLVEQRELALEREVMRRHSRQALRDEQRRQLSNNAEAIATLERQRDKLMVEAAATASEIRSMLQPVQSEWMDAIRALKPQLPMTAGSWEQWLAYATNRYDDGRRLGHQHGWAAASLHHADPRHGVLAKKGEIEVYFSPADIRALLSKLWAEQAPRDEVLFAARCRGSGVAQQQRAALLDGVTCPGRKSGSCSREDDGKVIHVRNNRIEDGLITFTETSWGESGKVGVVQSDLGQDYYVMSLFDSTQAFEAWFQSGGQSGLFSEALVHLTQGCRGTTPLAFHLALTKLVTSGTGIVLEETRGGLAWRHPAYRYELTYVPIALKKRDGSAKALSQSGVPTPVNDISDVFRAYRAPRTAYLVQVHAKVYYRQESATDAHGKEDASREDGVFTVTYTLELDEAKTPVGGMWGLIPFSSTREGAPEKEILTDQGPDRIWYYPKQATPEQGAFDRELIMKLYECSRSGSTTAVAALEVGEANATAQARICNL